MRRYNSNKESYSQENDTWSERGKTLRSRLRGFYKHFSGFQAGKVKTFISRDGGYSFDGLFIPWPSPSSVSKPNVVPSEVFP